jgi:hypothetical protein
MGYASDLGTGIVHDICPVTGYPRDSWGHLLQTTSLHDGTVIPDWDKPGTELPNITSPYGHLFYATGSGDDFICYDFEIVNAGPRGRFAVLHATANSETSHFIEGFEYEVLPCNSIAEQKQVIRCAFGMVDRAEEWCYEGWEKPFRHSIKGWNQSHDFFAIAVAKELFPYRFKNKTGTDLALRKANAAARKVALAIAFDKD